MSDLPYIQQRQEISITGQDSVGDQVNYVGADTNGNMFVKDYANGTTGSAVPTTAIQIGGSDGTNLRVLSMDSSGRAAMRIFDSSGNGIGSDTGNVGIQYLRTSTVQSIIASTNNSSTTNLASGTSFTGTADISLGQSSIEINVIANQPLTVKVQQSSDSINWDINDTYYLQANSGDARTFQSVALYWRIVVTNTGQSTTTYFRLQSALIPIANTLPRALTEAGNLPIAINEMTPFGPSASGLFDDTYDLGLDTTNRWNTPIFAGGGVVASNTPGMTALGTGTTANGYSYITSQYVFQQRAPGWHSYMNAINLEFPITTNAYRFWGWGNPVATPTATAPFSDAIGFEVATTGKLFAVCYSSGTRNVIADLSVSTGNGGQPVDNKVHKYFIWFRGDLSYWSIDEVDNIVATMLTGSPGPTVNALPLVMMAIAGSVAPVSNGVLTSNAIFVGDTTATTIRIQDGTYGWRKLTVNNDGSIPIVGNVPSSSVDSGNPVKIGGVYNSVLPTISTGNRVDLQLDQNGRMRLAASNYFHPLFSTRVQSATNVTTVLSTSVTATINPTKAGNTIIVAACCNAGTLTITDSASQSYSTAATLAGNATQTSKIFYFPNTTAGVTTVTISSTSSTDLNLVVTEYSGILTGSPLDQTSTHGATGTTTWTSNATPTTTQASELLIGTCMGTLHNNSTFTPATNWGSIATALNVRGGANLELFMADQNSVATGAYAFTGTNSQSDDLYASIATFKFAIPNMVVVTNSPITIKNGSGILRKVALNTIGTGSANVTLYDNITNSGTIIANLSLTSAIGAMEYAVYFNTGLTMVINSSTPDFTVVYE